MDRKMIFVLLLSGYISREPVATQNTETIVTWSSPAVPSPTSTSTESHNTGSAVSTPPQEPNPEHQHGFSQSGYISTKPVATQTTGTSDTTQLPGRRIVLQHDLSQPVTVVIIFAVIAGIIGIIVGSASLILLLRRRYREQTSAPKTSEQPEEIEDPPQ